jgi:uncharacterized membrane protein YfcA
MGDARLNNNGRLRRVAGGVLAAATAAISFWFTPEQLPLGQCAFRQATGLSCLTCGITRSFHATAHGMWAEAFTYHLLGPPLLIVIVGWGVLAILELLTGRRLSPRMPRGVMKPIVVALAVVWVSYGVLRAVGEALH